MRAFALSALAVVSLLAGCIAPPEMPTQLPAPAPTPLNLPWELSGCKAAVVGFSVPASAVTPHLPAGFRPVGLPEGLFGVSQVPNDASFGMEMFECEGTSYGSYFAFVAPPAELAWTNVTYQFYKWDVLVPDAARRAVLAERGIPALNGTAAFATFEVAGPAIAFDGQVALGNATHRFRGTPAAPNTPTGSFVEFTQVPRGIATWHAEFTWSQIAAGPMVVEVDDAGLAAKVLGPGPHAGGGFAGMVAFKPASIHLP